MFLPWVSGEWHIHRPFPDWWLAEMAAGLLICAGLVPIVLSFVCFVEAEGTPVPVAAPPHLVVSGPYRYVRNPIYAGFLVVLLGEALFFGSLGLLKYTREAMVVDLGTVHLFEEPTLARKFGADYDACRHSVRAWLPRVHPWRGGLARSTEEASRTERLPISSDERGPPMARLEPAGRAAAGLPTRIALHFARRAIAKLIARLWGIRDEELLALPRYRTSPLFSELDRLVLDYAVGMTRTPVEVPEDLFERLRQHLDQNQIVELTHHIPLENLRGRFNLALGIRAAGFSAGMVCALPDDAGGL